MEKKSYNYLELVIAIKKETCQLKEELNSLNNVIRLLGKYKELNFDFSNTFASEKEQVIRVFGYKRENIVKKIENLLRKIPIIKEALLYSPYIPNIEISTKNNQLNYNNITTKEEMFEIMDIEEFYNTCNKILNHPLLMTFTNHKEIYQQENDSIHQNCSYIIQYVRSLNTYYTNSAEYRCGENNILLRHQDGNYKELIENMLQFEIPIESLPEEFIPYLIKQDKPYEIENSGDLTGQYIKFFELNENENCHILVPKKYKKDN